MPPADLPPDIYFTPTPERVVAVMLDLAKVGPDDAVYDLGCGDGRILIAAARRGARGVGIDLDPERIAETQRNAAAAEIEDRVTLLREDIFESDLRPASVIALYLLDSLNVRLRPRILAQCRPGTRVVSYSFEMGEWMPDAHTPIAANGVSLWIVPAKVAGHWRADAGPARLEEVQLTQHFQMLSGSVRIDGRTRTIQAGRVEGERFTLALDDADATSIAGLIGDDRIVGNLGTPGRETEFTARREPRG